MMAVELEFYLLDRERDSDGRPLPALQMNGQRPRATRSMASTSWSSCSHSSMTCMPPARFQGLPARTAISEYAPGQVEITLQHRFDALQAIDEGVRYKRLVKGVANRHGLQACFMASRSPIYPATACTCTSAWPTPLATICSPAGPGRDPAAAPGHPVE